MKDISILKIGHRGDPGYPRRGENTIRSFQSALAAGADGLELDVRKTQDGRLVVIHDQAVDRTTNGKGMVAEMAYEEISKLDAGSGEPVPLLSEVLDRFAGKCLLNTELKESGTGGMVKAELLRRGLAGLPYPRCVLVSCFDLDDKDEDSDSSWEDLAAFPPGFPIALLANPRKISNIGEEGFVRTAKEMGALAIHPERTAVTASLVRMAHEAGLLVNAWTVNDPEEARELMGMGVDGLISDSVGGLGV